MKLLTIVSILKLNRRGLWLKQGTFMNLICKVIGADSVLLLNRPKHQMNKIIYIFAIYSHKKELC